MRRSTTALLLLPFLAACASVYGGSASDSAAPLAYGAQQGELRYQIADTAIIVVDAMGQTIEVPTISNATLGMTFAATETGVRVTAEWEEWEAILANPMGASERSSVEQLDGPLVFDLDHRGRTSVVGIPNMRGNSELMLDPDAIAHSFFPRLPAMVASPGMTWTDTISYISDRAGTYSDVQSVTTYTVVGDTVVSGARYLRVDFTGIDSMESEGAQMGMAFTQTAQGTSRGFFLWDQTAGRLVETSYEARLEGLMDMDGVPVPLGVAMNLSQKGRLLPGM